MLKLRAAIKTVLGSTFNVTHAGPTGNVTVAVSVGEDGTDDGLLLPAVFVGRYTSSGAITNIGGRAGSNDANLALRIVTVNTDTIDGKQLLDEIQDKLETLIRAQEGVIGSSFFTEIVSGGDIGPTYHNSDDGVWVSFERALLVKGFNVEAY